MKKLIFSAALVCLAMACTSENIEEDFPACDTSDMRFSTDITEIFSVSCFRCHDSDNAGSAGEGIDLSDFSVVKSYVENGRLMEAIEQNGNASSMPLSANKMDQCNIDKIKSWINEGAENI